MQTLHGRTCVFAGGTAGDGVDAVKALCAGGMNVVLMTNKPEKAQALVDWTREAGLPGGCSVFAGRPGMVAEHQAETYARIAEQYGSIDVIVCNTGNNGLLANLEDVTGEMLSAALNQLVVGAYKMFSAALPYLKQSQSPRVIFMTSLEGCRGGTHESFVNAVAKGALHALTVNCAARTAAMGITVNCISKAAIPRVEPQPEGAPDPNSLLPFLPVGRLGDPQDLAQAICFLASEETSYITGQTLELNGGLHLGR